MSIEPGEITIRNELRPGDIGYITYLHGHFYEKEYGYSIDFETYVAQGLCEFYHQYSRERDRIWLCEHKGNIVGFLLCMHRSTDSAQLRYFLVLPGYRGLGLGSRLLKYFIDFLIENNYKSAYLWTTHELITAASLYGKYGFVLSEERISTAFGRTLKEQRYNLITGL